MYEANIIAKYVIYKHTNNAPTITNLKLQKILYYIQGYSLKILKNPIFINDICCWSYGPVVPDVYFEYSLYGSEPLYQHDYDYSIFTRDQKKLFDKVIEACKDLKPFQLVEKTHSEEPWLNTKSKEKITLNTMNNYFSNNDPLNICGDK